ncbi:MAG: hypothetical protein K2Q12_11535 [Rickettsiales bacterium]|nr:hypothetical protein [Rickettsiales bacterium]
MPENIDNLPPDAEIARLKSRRCDPRWEGFKGFMMGALPALALGGLAGVGIAATTMAASFFFAPIPLVTAGIIAASVAGFSALVAGGQTAFREVREAHYKNYAIERAIQTVQQNAMAGIAPQALPEEAREIRRSRIVDQVLQRGRDALPSTSVERLQRQAAERQLGESINLH